MNETIKKILTDLIARYGVSLASDPGRCEGLLRDTCENCGKEIFLISNAARLRIPEELTSPRHSLPLVLIKGFLAKRMEDELGFSRECARWAVDCWAEALRLQEPAPEKSPDTGSQAPLQQGNDTTRSLDPGLINQWEEDLVTAPRTSRLSIISNLRHAPGGSGFRLLISSLKNDDPTVRTAAFEALCDPSAGTKAALIDALDNPDDGVAGRAAVALGILRENGAVPSLVAQLTRSPLVVGAAAWALGEIRADNAVTPLMALLHHPDERVAGSAAEALKKIGSLGPNR